MSSVIFRDHTSLLFWLTLFNKKRSDLNDAMSSFYRTGLMPGSDGRAAILDRVECHLPHWWRLRADQARTAVITNFEIAGGRYYLTP